MERKPITRVRSFGYTLALAVLAAGCGGDGNGAGARQGAAATASDTTAARPAMAMPSMGLVAGMRAHLDTLADADLATLMAAVSAHERQVAELLDAMNADMRAMNMSADAAWRALTDSVRRDLAALPDARGRALATRMRAHAAMVRRLLERHERMMQAM
jgi:hypothetical protein